MPYPLSVDFRPPDMLHYRGKWISWVHTEKAAALTVELCSTTHLPPPLPKSSLSMNFRARSASAR